MIFQWDTSSFRLYLLAVIVCYNTRSSFCLHRKWIHCYMLT